MNRPRRRAIALLSAWVAVVAGCVTGRGQAPVIVGYFAEWGIYARAFQVTNVAPHLVTHLNYAFLQPVYDAESDSARLQFHDRFAAVEKVFPGDPANAAFYGNLRQLTLLKQRHPSLKVLLSIGGATLSGDFSDIAASARARRALAESCADVLASYGGDGIDVDWEFPVAGGVAGMRHRAEDGANLLQLARELRGRLDQLEAERGQDYLLTVATSATGESLSRRYVLPELAAAVDWLNVMAYRMAGPWLPHTSHQAPLRHDPEAPEPALSVHQAVEALVALGVPRNKVVLGIPLYGLGFKKVDGDRGGLYQRHGGMADEGSWHPGEFDYRDLRHGTRGNSFLAGAGFVPYWDAASDSAYLYHPDRRLFISYESPRSAALKAAYVRQTGLRGVMFWSLDSDTRDYELARAVHGVLHEQRSATEAANVAADVGSTPGRP